jgi:hypothetical protein
MALSQQDKDCIEAYHAILTHPGTRLDATQQGHLDDILTGDEAARIAAAKYYAANVRLVAVQATLADIDQQKTDLQTEEAALISYTT